MPWGVEKNKKFTCLKIKTIRPNFPPQILGKYSLLEGIQNSIHKLKFTYLVPRNSPFKSQFQSCQDLGYFKLMSLSCEYVYIQKIYIFTVKNNYSSRDLLSQFSFKGIPQRFSSSRATFPPFREAKENTFHQAPNRAFQVALVLKSLSANTGDSRHVGLIPVFDPCVRKIPWRRSWQPTPVFLPGESHGQRSLAGYSPWGHKELDMTEVIQHACRPLTGF